MSLDRGHGHFLTFHSLSHNVCVLNLRSAILLIKRVSFFHDFVQQDLYVIKKIICGSVVLVAPPSSRPNIMIYCCWTDMEVSLLGVCVPCGVQCRLTPGSVNLASRPVQSVSGGFARTRIGNPTAFMTFGPGQIPLTRVPMQYVASSEEVGATVHSLLICVTVYRMIVETTEN